MLKQSIFRDKLLSCGCHLLIMIMVVFLAFPTFVAADGGEGAVDSSQETIPADTKEEKISGQEDQETISAEGIDQDDLVEEVDNSKIKKQMIVMKDPSIYFSRSKFEINKGKKKYLPLVKKNMPRGAVIQWKSSNKKVASVNKSGRVTAKKVGTAKITATLKGTSLKRTCTVEVVHTKNFRVRATGYCNCARCSGPGNPRTASGRYPKQGRTLAVDRRKIPLGSKIIMKGKTYYAEDVGGAIKGNRIDVFFRSHSRAQSYGVKRVKIKVYYKK